MKVKLAVLDKDVNYLKRLSGVFSTKYAEQVEIYSFTDMEMALQVLDSVKIDVFLANEEFDVNQAGLPRRCGFAYLVDSPSINMLNGQTAVCKFQRAELVYRQVLGIFAEKNANTAGHGAGDGAAEVIAFCSPAGGVGTSTMAAACAVHFSEQGRRSLYLCLEPFGSADSFFSGEGQANLSDIIFALKSKKANVSMKLESCLKQSRQGVCFYSQPRVALDLMELSGDETRQLIDEFRLSGGYDVIVLDMAFDLSAQARDICRQAGTVIWVSDGSDLANRKLCRAYESLEIQESGEEMPLTDRLCVAYNRYSSRTGRQIEDLPVRTIGGVPRFENRTAEQVMEELGKQELFEKLT